MGGELQTLAFWRCRRRCVEDSDRTVSSSNHSASGLSVVVSCRVAACDTVHAALFYLLRCSWHSRLQSRPLVALTAEDILVVWQVQALQPQAAVGSRPHSLPLREAFAQVVRNEGFLSLWKGNGVTILHRLPYSAVNFWAYERSNEVWKRIFPAPARQGTTPADVIRRLMAGATAGMTACALVRGPAAGKDKHG